MSGQTYIVKGMTCDGCVNSVTNAIKYADPNAKVDVILDSGRVTVAGTVDEAAIKTAVEDAGFDFEGRAD